MKDGRRNRFHSVGEENRLKSEFLGRKLEANLVKQAGPLSWICPRNFLPIYLIGFLPILKVSNDLILLQFACVPDAKVPD